MLVWPHLLYIEFIVGVFVTALLVVWSIGIMAPLARGQGNRQARKLAIADRALRDLDAWMTEQGAPVPAR